MTPRRAPAPSLLLALLLAAAPLAGACGDDGGGGASDDVASGDTAGPDAAGDAEDDTAGPSGPIVDIAPFVPACELPAAEAARTYEASVRWDTYGVPYIAGGDLGDVIFAQAYAVARDHVCTLADQFVASRSERALYFGPGDNNANLTSDLGWRGLGLQEQAACSLGAMSADGRAMLAAFAAGYNRYLEETGVANLPADCAGADWVRPVDSLDVATYLLALVERASGQPLLAAIAAAEPPSDAALAPADGPMSAEPARTASIEDEDPPVLASNGWALGKDRTEGGRGMLFANPHFPWEGALRLHEVQLEVPGEMKVHGVALVGVPGVLIGFNEHVAWTHTVSASQRFTLYTLTLDPTDPTVYLYDGERRRMATRTVTVQVKQPDGSLAPVEKTFYYSHFGPILNIPPLGWRANAVATLGDANLRNTAFLDQFRRMNLATSLEAFKAAFEEESGIPWVNTMAVDAAGTAFYTDATPVPALSDEALAWWAEAVETGGPGTPQFLAKAAIGAFGAFAFDGSLAEHAWVALEGARDPGITPFRLAPQLERTDYVMNANDSHWLSNPAALLEGYSPLYGPERTVRSRRTRMNLIELEEQGAGGQSGADGLFSHDELADVRTGGRALLAELLRDEVVARCTGVPSAVVDGATVPIADACATLAAWDGRLKATSVGAPLWREVLGAIFDLRPTASIYATEFDVEDPIGTPSGLFPAPAEGPDPIPEAVARAVLALEAAGFAPDAALGDVQYTLKGDTRLPVPGGFGYEGAVNIIAYSRDTTTLLPKIPRAPVINPTTGLTEDGYLVNYGTSFVMALEFQEDGPHARALLTYSQSADPASPHFADQTALFGEDGWREVPFQEADLLADPNLVTRTVSSE